jgi:hypothetical protein
MIYVASSWRNEIYPSVLAVLHAAHQPFYDFRHPAAGSDGFHWHEIDSEWQQWTTTQYREALTDPRAEEGFRYDMEALKSCTTLLLVLPCGRSSHLELGYAIGAGKRTVIYFPPNVTIEPELMYKAVDHLCLSMGEVLDALGVPN